MDLIISCSEIQVFSLPFLKDASPVLLTSSSSRLFHLFICFSKICWPLSFSRELISEGQTGGLVIFQDRPGYWDAWGELLSIYLLWAIFNFFFLNWTEVDISHLETAQPLEFSNVSVVAQGPLRAAVHAEVKYGQSTISITVMCFMLMCVFKLSDEDAWKISLDATTGKFLCMI